MNSENRTDSPAATGDDSGPKVACEVCITEIPASGAKSEETSDYVAHFCGMECYEKWRKEAPNKS